VLSSAVMMPNPRAGMAVGSNHKCACGGRAQRGECDACRKRRIAQPSRGDNVSASVQRAAAAATEASVVSPGVRQVLASPGRPLDGPTRAFFEPRMGQDLSRVRVHHDASAAQSARSINALAYTAGQHIAFGAGYVPRTPAGQRLLAHELTHVVQQIGAADDLQRRSLALSSSNAAEREAETASEALAKGQRVRVSEREEASTDRRPSVQRKIRVGATTLDRSASTKLTSALISGPLKALVSQLGAGVVTEAISELQSDPELLTFSDLDAVASNVRVRVLVSRYMRVSQGSSGIMKAFSYPDREADKTKGVKAKVNDAAAAFWGLVQGWPGAYYIDLSPKGKANAYQALIRLFTEQRDPHKRTLIHCDYLVSVIEFRAYAENLGEARFNALVASGALPMRLKYDGFDDLKKLPLPTLGGPAAAKGRQPPLKQVSVGGKEDLLVGDHVVFYNHESYDVLTSVNHDVWRLENAIVIDRAGGQFRYQGHGYPTPVKEDALLDGMLFHYNRNIDRARKITARIAQGGKSAGIARAELAKEYPYVKEANPGHWTIDGPDPAQLYITLCGRRVSRDLKHLTRAEAPALHSPCDGKIRVNRPIEATP